MRTNTLFFALLLSATTALCGAPVESGPWVEDTPNFALHQCAGGKVNGDTFELPKSPNGSTSGPGCGNGHLRAERRYNDNYSSGVHQFSGEFKINSMSGSRICLKQTFNGSGGGNGGPYFLLAVEKGGDLYKVGGTPIAKGVATIGATVRVNTVHDVAKRRLSLYINGKEMYRDDNAPKGSFYDKIGTYATDSGTGAISVTWSDVQFWHKG
ncbi:hypothetical protein VHEMI07603 [[Torrubiella] hemipterigena]|uniref:Alginate lyase 2 domain-containing protein n=1 Tax=[Torrubiella] hemipterigena TaxID=1531966 RepID=A0A0A1TLM1_9HYPO|nr:hypothetical protein VHEMI07603 [[Torrubiella] hemipterigena]